jgi:hypothetical protein
LLRSSIHSALVRLTLALDIGVERVECFNQRGGSLQPFCDSRIRGTADQQIFEPVEAILM